MNTLVVNLFAGPGAGKSTTAARVFADLKMQGYEVEIAHEYAKDLTWEERHRTIRYQPYVAVKQMYRVHRLLGQVEIVITDSPILLSLVYKGEGYSKSFEDFLIETYRSWTTLSVLLLRHADKQYSHRGRRQGEQEAKELDSEIGAVLSYLGIDPLVAEGPPASHEPIVEAIKHSLNKGAK